MKALIDSIGSGLFYLVPAILFARWINKVEVKLKHEEMK